MAEITREKAKANMNSNSRVIAVILAVATLLVTFRLAELQIVHHDVYSRNATNAQWSEEIIPAIRGTIYDANGTVLAQSAQTWQLYLIPEEFKNEEFRKQVCKDVAQAFELDSFGYSSLHYVCRIPREMYFDPSHPEINEFRFEVQMRTALQHVWATMNHDSGYKSGVEVPVEYLRSMNCLAGMLELADAQFSSIRTAINDYRRQVQSLVASGDFSEVPLNGDTYRSYLQLHPFDKLAKRIAAINQAEIHESSALPYFEVLRLLGFTTLGDVEKLVKEHSDEAYLLAVHQLGNTDLDIVSSTVAIQNLCVVYMLKNGGGVAGLKRIFDTLGVPSDANFYRAKRIMDIAQTLPFLN